MGVQARLIPAASLALPSGAAMGTASQSSRVRELVDRIRTAYHFRKYHNAWAAGRFCQMNVGYNLRVPEEVPVTDEKAVPYATPSRCGLTSPLPPPTGLMLASPRLVEARA